MNKDYMNPTLIGVPNIYRGNDSIFDQSSKCITFRDIYLYVDDPTSQHAWLWEEVRPTTILTGFEKTREQAEKQMQGFVENPLIPDVLVDEMAKSNPLRYGWMGWSTPLDAILYLMYTIWKKLPS